MTLPVSSYEELLARVRSLTTETIQIRREITSSLCDRHEIIGSSYNVTCDNGNPLRNYATHPQRRTLTNEEPIQTTSSEFGSVRGNGEKPTRPTSLFSKKEDEIDIELKEIDEKRNSPGIGQSKGGNTFHLNDWGPESLGLWHSGPSSLSLSQPSDNNTVHQDLSSVMSFNSSVGSDTQSLNSISSSSRRTYSHQQLGVKVEMVYNLLSMLGTNNREDMSKTFLAMSSSPESCHAMRQSGCLPLLIQLIHSPELDVEVRNRAAEALHNIVHAQTDEKRRRREVRVLKLLQQVREYCDELKLAAIEGESAVQCESEKHPVAAVGALMKFSFDAEHRQAICTLGGLHAITELIQLDHEAHGSSSDETVCVTMRRYAGMSLTNLTFGDCKNKALLCSFNKFMRALVDQLKSPNEDLRQVTASVLRNLSWRADSESEQALRDVGAVTALTFAAMEEKKESTLKSILSALWNLSAHCFMNKVDICSVPGALAFLVKMLRYKSASHTLAIVENAGGIIQNISSHIAVREDYRQILRDNNCFEILLEQLKSPSLTIVSNACGTLWNLSARCSEDQRRLWEMGAASMLRSLVQSKHKLISMGSSAALKNLLTANPNGNLMTHLDSTAKSLGLQNLPTLFVRKQRALEQELDITLAETCDNIESGSSPTHTDKPQVEAEVKKPPKRSDSHESIKSTQSDSVYERLNQIALKNENKLLENRRTTLHDSLNEKQSPRKAEDQKLMKRYKASMIPTPASKKMNQEKINEKTREESQGDNNINVSLNVIDSKGKGNAETRDTNRRGIPVLKGRSKHKTTGHVAPSYGQCFSGNNFSPQYEEEYPINYSLKYSETETYKSNSKNEDVKRKLKEYTDYAETDLDQPTDFSLKYGEKTSSDEEIKNAAFGYYVNDKSKESGCYTGPTECEDTTRIYYTEGTPYEGTPYNFSSSNSMTDLRMDAADDHDNSKESFLEKKGDDRKFGEENNSTAGSMTDERKESGCHYENIEKDCQHRLKRLSREFESGDFTPESPVQYCEEGTPGGCFSRVSSLSSLSGGKETSGKMLSEKNHKKLENKHLKKLAKEEEDGSSNKVVKFGVTELCASEDQTPLMFSRCSSMNSLSSFDHITQAIPDDRSSVVSDFSRMTSGIISPSELPDSPTQSVPPSPKRDKAPDCFPVKAVFPQKKSVFEDDVATYKQEDTPIEFSRATSLSSLNIIDNPVKTDIILKTDSVASFDETQIKEGNHPTSSPKSEADDLKDQMLSEKAELGKEKFELTSVTEEDESILADCINIGIQENSRKQQKKYGRPMQKNANSYVSSSTPQDSYRHVRQNNGLVKPKFSNESGKVYTSYEVSDDAVHTYHTEGTPANISHAGSHSDLSTLSMVSCLPPSGIEDNSDDGSFCSGDTESMLAECIQSGMPKAKPNKDKRRVSSLDKSLEMTMGKNLSGETKEVNLMPSQEIYFSGQPRFDYLRRKDNQLTAKDEISTFATENSPCNFSVRSSLSDLTVNSVDSPIALNRSEAHGESSSLHKSQPSPCSINLIESEDGGKISEDRDGAFISPKSITGKGKGWNVKASVSDTGSVSYGPDSRTKPGKTYPEDLVMVRTRVESPSSLSVESFDSSEPTPLEQALLEQCIHSGMPQKSNSKKLDGNNFKAPYEDSDKMISVASAHLSRLTINEKDAAESSKNLNISSAVVEGDTTADENPKTGIENLENTNMKESSQTKNSGESKEEIARPEGPISGSVEETGKRKLGDVEGLKKSHEVVPNFIIGSEVTDPKFLEKEAAKICHEIRKHQEMDMGCSLTSEVSLVSCSSFLDAGDYSLFEVSNEVLDFDESESTDRCRSSSRGKSGPFRKPLIPQSCEPVSLPSLGSIKNDMIEAVDLENSIISVASITSEIAENFSRDKDCFNTYTKSRSDTMVEGQDDTLGDSILASKEDETLNADFFDDDNSLHSQENLPLDSEPPKEHAMPTRALEPNRKMTPKERRKTVQERYRTYTIRDWKANLAQEAGKVTENLARYGKEIEGLPEAAESSDRHDFNINHLYHGVKNDYNQGVVDNNHGARVSSPFLGFSKEQELLKLGNQTAAFSSDARNGLLGIGPAERKELVDNAKLVALSLKTAVHDVDSEMSLMSDSEAEVSHVTSAIDTATYSKGFKTYVQDNYSREDYPSLDSYTVESEKEEEEEEEDVEKRGPKISKPDDRIPQEKLEEAAKAIRGRRKNLYSSPLRKAGQGFKSSPSSPKITQTTVEAKKHVLPTTKSLPNVPKSIPKMGGPPVLQRQGTFTKEEGNEAKKSGAKPARGIPVLARCPEPQAGTYVRNKSAPVLRNTRVSSEDSRMTRPTSTCVTKNEKKIELDASQRKNASVGAVQRTQSAVTVKRHSTSGPTYQGMKNSSSNQSLKSNSSAKSTSSVKARNPGVQSPKSTSGASSSPGSPSDKGKPKTPKKEVTSKIASLWKKVEESKQKNKNVKDNRVWIGREKDEKAPDEVLVLETEEIVDIPTGKIVKSSTFQGLATERVSENSLDRKNEAKEGIPRSYSKWPEDKSGKAEGRSVISAIVAPYNYNPPTSVGLTPSAYTEVETFKKGQMKITTV